MIAVLLMVIATVLSGNARRVDVVCNVKGDPGVDGYVVLGTGPMHIRPEWCAALSEPRETRQNAYAVLVLGHELGHFVLNTLDEMRAECWGLSHVAAVARLLHWDPVRTLRDARWWTFCGVKA